MEVHIINYNEAGTELKKQSFIHYHHFILFFNQINAKVLQSTQRAKDERVRNASTHVAWIASARFRYKRVNCPVMHAAWSTGAHD